MDITTTSINTVGIKFLALEANFVVARAHLYLIHNELHKEPFGLLEDVFVVEDKRGKGIGKQLVTHVIKTAKRSGCYKLIATSRFARPAVHKLYEELGFERYGYEFRVNL